VGGIINFRFLIGNSNITGLIRSFQETCIGKPALPPFWSLGFHQSRWGYDSVDTLNDVLSNYSQYGLPLDTIWSDIDYMVDFKDFVIDEDNFPLDKMKKITD
jgi:alpha-glucosidase